MGIRVLFLSRRRRPHAILARTIFPLLSSLIVWSLPAMPSRKKKRLKALAASSKARKFGKAQSSLPALSKNHSHLSGDPVADAVVADVVAMGLAVSDSADSMCGTNLPLNSQISLPLAGDSVADDVGASVAAPALVFSVTSETQLELRDAINET